MSIYYTIDFNDSSFQQFFFSLLQPFFYTHKKKYFSILYLYEAIEKALNVRAKVKEEDDSKQTQDDIWKCEYFARTKSPNKKYLPSDKHKEDGSTICWNV